MKVGNKKIKYRIYSIFLLKFRKGFKDLKIFGNYKS